MTPSLGGVAAYDSTIQYYRVTEFKTSDDHQRLQQNATGSSGGSMSPVCDETLKVKASKQVVGNYSKGGNKMIAGVRKQSTSTNTKNRI